MKLKDAELSVRTFHCLLNFGLKGDDDLTVLAQCFARDLIRVPNLGRKSLSEIMELLASYDMHLVDATAPVARSSKPPTMQVIASTARCHYAFDLWWHGETYREIGQRLGISKERASHLIYRWVRENYKPVEWVWVHHEWGEQVSYHDVWDHWIELRTVRAGKASLWPKDRSVP